MRRKLGIANTKGDTIAPALRRRPAAVILAIGLMAILAGAVMSRVEKAQVRATTIATTPVPAPTRSAAAASSRLHSRLSFQPEANKMRRRLGQRFTRPGGEMAISSGTLTVDGQVHPISIIRTQDEVDGERVAIAVDGGAPLLSWNPRDGAMSNGAIPAAKERSLIERIVLDSPDQFVLAQTRGASYYAIAQNVIPVPDDNSESYSGPSWDLVRIAEPQHGAFNKPENLWRIFYINSATGLIDKILYDEQGSTVTCELSGWTNRAGEWGPSLIRWSRAGQLLMELSVNNVNRGPKQ